MTFQGFWGLSRGFTGFRGRSRSVPVDFKGVSGEFKALQGNFVVLHGCFRRL